MINLNTVSNVSNVGSSTGTSNTAAKADAKKEISFVNTGASTVVDLQTKVSDKTASSAYKIDASNAKDFVADIASMLKGSGSASNVQANLNGFDAARLLA